MSSEQPANTPASRRRAQRRQATYDEMVSLARTALREGRQVSLRAIAADMGMTAPALYRYVDSHAALQDALVQSILGEVADRLAEVDTVWPEDQPGHRVICSLYSFREWALSRPEEFRLVFGQPRTPESASTVTERLTPAALRFVRHFMVSLVRLHEDGLYDPSPERDIPVGVLPALTAFAERWTEEDGLVAASPGLWWRAVSDWVVLCGVLRMEVDQMPGDLMVADDALFRQTVALCARRAGEPSDAMAELLVQGAGGC